MKKGIGRSVATTGVVRSEVFCLASCTGWRLPDVDLHAAMEHIANMMSKNFMLFNFGKSSMLEDCIKNRSEIIFKNFVLAFTLKGKMKTGKIF
jgi:hypothetical protein